MNIEHRTLNIEHRMWISLLPAIARHTQCSSFFCYLAQARRAGRSFFNKLKRRRRTLIRRWKFTRLRRRQRRPGFDLPATLSLARRTGVRCWTFLQRFAGLAKIYAPLCICPSVPEYLLYFALCHCAFAPLCLSSYCI